MTKTITIHDELSIKWINEKAVQYNLAVFSYDEHFKAINGIQTGNRLIDFITH